jgi:hypothetical protein
MNGATLFVWYLDLPAAKAGKGLLNNSLLTPPNSLRI